MARTKASVAAEDAEEGLLGHLDVAQHAHLLLALALALQQLHLAGDVAAVALGCHVLAQRLDRLPRENLAAHACLNSLIEKKRK